MTPILSFLPQSSSPKDFERFIVFLNCFIFMTYRAHPVRYKSLFGGQHASQTQLDAYSAGPDHLYHHCLLELDSGAENTSHTSVTLTLSATDDVGVTHYFASTSQVPPAADDGGWAPYQTNGIFSIVGATGAGIFPRTVYAWFKNAAGNISESVMGINLSGCFRHYCPHSRLCRTLWGSHYHWLYKCDNDVSSKR